MAGCWQPVDAEITSGQYPLSYHWSRVVPGKDGKTKIFSAKVAQTHSSRPLITVIDPSSLQPDEKIKENQNLHEASIISHDVA